jgi:hypothetical protein
MVLTLPRNDFVNPFVKPTLGIKRFLARRELKVRVSIDKTRCNDGIALINYVKIVFSARWPHPKACHKASFNTKPCVFERATRNW